MARGAVRAALDVSATQASPSASVTNRRQVSVVEPQPPHRCPVSGNGLPFISPGFWWSGISAR